jgi:hypothetical protein
MFTARIPALVLLISALLVSCSELSGVDVAVVGTVPPNFVQLVNTAALDAGFTDASSHFPGASQRPDALFFEIPHTDGGEAVLLETGYYDGRLHIMIGRPIYAGYSASEVAAMVTLLSALRQNGLILSKIWVHGVKLPRDLDKWLSANSRGV